MSERSSRGCWPADVRTIISPSHAEKRCRYHGQDPSCAGDSVGPVGCLGSVESFNGCPVGKMEERVLFGDSMKEPTWRMCNKKKQLFTFAGFSLLVIYKGRAYSDDTDDDRSSSLKDKSQIMMEEPRLHKLHKPNLRLVVCRSYLCFAQLQVKPMWMDRKNYWYAFRRVIISHLPVIMIIIWLIIIIISSNGCKVWCAVLSQPTYYYYHLIWLIWYRGC